MKNTKHKRTMQKVAQHFGSTPEIVEAEMQETIDQVWEDGDLEAQAYRDRYFPDGKPTVEEFIAVVVELVKEKQKNTPNRIDTI